MMKLSRFDVYDALPPPMQQGRPISDGLIVSYDRILANTTETKTAEQKTTRPEPHALADDQSSMHLVYHGTSPLALSCRLQRVLIVILFSEHYWRPASLDEYCLNGP